MAGGVGDRGIGIEIGGSLFSARIMKAAGEAGDQFAVAADVVKAAGFAERPGAVIDDFRLAGLKRARAEGAIPGAALLAVEAVARRARMAEGGIDQRPAVAEGLVQQFARIDADRQGEGAEARRGHRLQPVEDIDLVVIVGERLDGGLVNIGGRDQPDGRRLVEVDL
ncbi:hypothetical protein D9M70_501810 [compost metagenome]